MVRTRQTIAKQWLIVDERLGHELWPALRRLPKGSGVLLIRRLTRIEKRQVRCLAEPRGLHLVEERPGAAARVHDVAELRRALMRRTALILLSPLFETRSHPGWRPMGRMRAAALARLAGRKAIALGGMNRKRYAKIAPLGFVAWAGIDAFRI